MTTGAHAAKAEDTFPKLLLRNARIYSGKPAMREKDLGIWQTWSWSEVLDEVRAFSCGLSGLGIGSGDKVAIVGDNRPRLYWTICAVQALGAVPIPVYQDSVADEMIFALKHAGVTCAVVEDQEQVDKILEIKEKYDAVKDIIYCDSRGMANYKVDGLLYFEEVQAQGREGLKSDLKAESKWLEQIALGSSEDIAVILYTSGTTGTPKGVVLTMGSVIWAGKTANDFDKLDVNERVIAYLPMAWIGDHVFSYAQSYECGYCVSCPESPETIAECRREIGATYAFAPPRVYENIITQTVVQMEDASKIKRKLFQYFIQIARKVGEKILNGEQVAIGSRLLYALGEFIVYAPLKNRYGLSAVRVAYTAGEAIGPEIFRFYRSLGVNLKQLYGQTEASVYVTNQPDGEVYDDTVGRPLSEIEIKIDDNGEVLYRSPGIFKEYYKNPKATRLTKTKDGWVRSGDAGFINEQGHLKIIDRAKDVGKLKDGTLFPPKYIENKLKFFPNVREVVCFGQDRDYVSAFVNIDLTAVGSWAERNHVSYASYQELAGYREVYDMIGMHVDEVNRELSREERVAGAQIKRFLILHKELDADDGEITRTAKVRRSFVAERYAPLVKALYDRKKTNQHIKTQMTFEDGRKGFVEGVVQICDMELYAPQVKGEAVE